MEKYLFSICLAGLGIVCIFIAGKSWPKKRRVGLDIFLCFIIGLVFFYFAAMVFRTIPNGLPVKLSDGEYKIQPLSNYTDKKGEEWILAHVLEKDGKIINGLKPYTKISRSRFGYTNVIIGELMTLRLITFPSQQYLVVK